MKSSAIWVGLAVAWVAIALLVDRYTGVDFAQLTTFSLIAVGLAMTASRRWRPAGYVCLGLAAAGLTVVFHG